MMLGALVNASLNPLGLEVRRRPAKGTPWDRQFAEWIAAAQRQNRDPNDVADEKWGDVRHLIDKYYGPHLRPDATVLELGPGSGRITRHLIDRCGRLVLVDASDFVIKWITDYLVSKGKQHFVALKVSDCRLRPVADASVDFIVSDGVFHHLDIEDFHRYAIAFRRVLAPGGALAFNFVNLMAPEGYALFRAHAERSDKRDVFRWHHPEMVECVFRQAGFDAIELHHERVRAGDFVTYVSGRRPR
jgi:cyclopropane fatty-acyl-phospholipid synthase-like methyltransferase